MVSIFLTSLIIIIVDSKGLDGLLFRQHGEVFYPFGVCAKFRLVNDHDFGYLSLNEEGDEISFMTCSDEECSSCSEYLTTPFKTGEFLPIPIFGGGESGRFKKIGRILSIKENERNDFLKITFTDQESCENKDISKAVSVNYYDHNHYINLNKCMNVGSLFFSEETRMKCHCDKNIHEVVCNFYENLLNPSCEGQPKTFPDQNENPCSGEYIPERLLCGDIRIQEHLIQNGVFIEISTERYYENKEVIKGKRCDKCIVSRSNLVVKLCEEDCRTGCKTLISQNFRMKENVIITNFWLSVMDTFASFFYAYGNELLRIEKGKRNELGFYDLIELDKSDAFAGGIDITYSSYRFEVCDRLSRILECLPDGSVIEKRCEKDGKTFWRTHEESECGAIKHHHGDLKQPLSLVKVSKIILAVFSVACIVKCVVVRCC